MKRKLILGLLAGVLAIHGISCETTYKLVLDEKNPQSRNATLYFNSVGSSGWYYVSKWNDKDIKKSLYGNKKRPRNGDVAILDFPAGDNKITFDVEFHDKTFVRGKTTVYTSKNVEFQYDFEPGKKYRIAGVITRFKDFTSVEYEIKCALRLLDITSGDILLKEWEIPADIK